MMDNQLLIHIGYRKTGTTWLQKSFFNNPKTGFWLPFERRELVFQFAVPHPLDFNAEACRKRLDNIFAQHEDKTGYPVISLEQLSGYSHTGGYDSKEIANRLADVFPTAKILIVIRKQVDMVLSIYNQYVKGGGILSLRRYMQKPAPMARIHVFDLASFRYHRLISHYIQLFGHNNVLVLPYELFKYDPQMYIAEIMTFCNVPQLNLRLPYTTALNRSTPYPATILLSRLNRIICKNFPMNPYPLIRIRTKSHRRIQESIATLIDVALPSSFNTRVAQRARRQVEEQIDGFYRESNHITAELTGLDLAQYGYQW